MKIKVRSSYDDSELEREISKAIAKADENGFYLDNVQYSTAYDENEQAVLRSALLFFEEYADEDEEEEYEYEE